MTALILGAVATAGVLQWKLRRDNREPQLETKHAAATVSQQHKPETETGNQDIPPVSQPPVEVHLESYKLETETEGAHRNPDMTALEGLRPPLLPFTKLRNLRPDFNIDALGVLRTHNVGVVQLQDNGFAMIVRPIAPDVPYNVVNDIANQMGFQELVVKTETDRRTFTLKHSRWPKDVAFRTSANPGVEYAITRNNQPLIRYTRSGGVAFLCDGMRQRPDWRALLTALGQNLQVVEGVVPHGLPSVLQALGFKVMDGTYKRQSSE
jgi:hypothetical protein